LQNSACSIAGAVTVLFGAAWFGADGAAAADTNMADTVNRQVLRVCASRANLPYSNEKREGFENKIAAIVADELHLPLKFAWSLQGPQFLRSTLLSKRCDLVIGTAQSDDVTLNTNHYLRSTYALVFRAGQGLDDVRSLFDPRLKDKRVGVQAGAPAADYIAKAGLMAKAKPYKMLVDTRFENPMQEMAADVRSGEIDVGVLWGPYAGYFAQRDGEKLTIAPILEEIPSGPKLEYRVTMGVRIGDNGWKRQINDIIAKRRADITAVLLSYSVPLINEDNTLVTAPGP
jgi:quinoprotein dehydrogenase-associated probable ABC transporter substrate-binding protein